MKDVQNLGFRGEVAFVKPGYAFNKLVPEKKAIFATDLKAAEAIKSIDVKYVPLKITICRLLNWNQNKKKECLKFSWESLKILE